MTPESRDKLAALLKSPRGEGTGPLKGGRMMPYTDTVGVLTIGYGRAIGRIGIAVEEAEHLLQNDIDRSIGDLNFAAPWWKDLDDVRQRAICEMVFQLGLSTFLDFRRTREALRQQQYGIAADHLLDSLWHTQTKERVERIAAMIRTGMEPL